MKRFAMSVCGFGVCCWAATVVAQPGTLLDVVTVPVPSPSCCGIGIAVDCEDPPNLFYTNSFSAFLHKMDSAGNALGSVAIADAAGTPISFGAIAWDEARQVIWGGTDSSGNPVKVYKIDPATGVATFAFTAFSAGCCGFCDGITYDAGDNKNDPDDDTIWVSDDVADRIDNHDADAPYAHNTTLFPTDAAGNPMTLISGHITGSGGTLYVGRNGLGQIDRVNKTTGASVGTFATPGGRDEDMECDVQTFAPKTAIWSRDAYNNTVTAIEVEDGTCNCGGAPPTPAVSEWGMVVISLLLLTGLAIKFGQRRGVQNAA